MSTSVIDTMSEDLVSIAETIHNLTGELKTAKRNGQRVQLLAGIITMQGAILDLIALDNKLTIEEARYFASLAREPV